MISTVVVNETKTHVRVKTPCVGICSTGIAGDVCRGCKRFAHEVIEWNAYPEEARQAVSHRTEQFIAQCVGGKLEITDINRLQKQLDYQQITYDPEQDAYTWLYALLRHGASQIANENDYGFSKRLECFSQSLPEITVDIEKNVFTLAEAYFERHVGH